MIFKNEFSDEYPFLRKYTSPVKQAERPIVGRDVEMDRIMAAMLRPELCNVMLLAEAGSGKAQPVDTWIPVADDRGYVRLGDIKVGDYVFNENGEPVEVVGVFPQGLKRAYRVSFTDGTSSVCNNEHLWSARTRVQRSKDQHYSVHTLQDMMDYGIVDESFVWKKMWYVPRNKAVQRKPVVLPMDPYALGMLIGIGRQVDGLLMVVSDKESVVRIVADAIGAKGYVKNLECSEWRFLDSDLMNGDSASYVQTDDLEKLLFGNMIFDSVSVDPYIPEKYLIGSVEQRMNLLRGLMDANGCLSGSDECMCVLFSSRSKDLCENVRELAASLGYRTMICADKKSDDSDENLTYKVYFKVSNDEALDLFSVSEYRDRIKQYAGHDKKYDDIAISSVEDLGYDTEMVCIYVNCPSHLYQTGKEHIVTHNTALVQGTMLKDTQRYYLEVDLSHMIADLTDANQMADRLKTLFNETEAYCKNESQEIVLFIDEFHQIVQLSAAAVEVLKPLLADSGTRGIRVIAATTYVEFRKWISPNQPLVERLQRINLEAPSKKMVVQILRGMAKRYGVDNQFYNNHLFELIYEYTNRYIPANAQPRKSILVLDSMVGWYRYAKRKLNTKLLADVIYESEGVNVAFRVDATTIKKELDSKVFAQDFATRMIQDRLQICVADLNDSSRPMASFLFTGSSGTGKGCWDEEPVPIYTEDGSVVVKRHGDLEVGDYVFNRKGEPVLVTGVYHRGLQDVYRVTLFDGRQVIVDSSHLWTWKHKDGSFTTTSMTALADIYIEDEPIYIPMNDPVQYPECAYNVDPYSVGAAIANGWFSGDVLLDSPELIAICDNKKFIPKSYQYGSVEQRWALIRGLFDNSAGIDYTEHDWFNLIFTTESRQLVEDVQNVLFSLGVMSSIMSCEDEKFRLCVRTSPEQKPEFFDYPDKKDVVEHSVDNVDKNVDYDLVQIVGIEKLDEQLPTTCIMVEDDEHLYQTANYIVTHNTEVTKQLSKVLFNDERRLIRFDMTEYAEEDSLDMFKRELTARVWERPYSIVLLDEIEKACAPVTRVLLQVLDDGRLSDENNREVSFINCYIIMTTNAGSEIYKTIGNYDATDTGSGVNLRKYEKLIRESISTTTGSNRFPPELLGRIDTIVPFWPLSQETQIKIVKSKLIKLCEDVRDKHNIKVAVSPRVVDYIVKDNLDTDANSGGARAVVSKINSEVVTAVAAYINQYPDDDAIIVDVHGKMAYEDKNKLESEASIVVHHYTAAR